MAQYTEITARGVIRKPKFTDSWFVCRYGMNLYRGCQHACSYCDGRAEKYRVEGNFGEEIQVKVNAPALLRQEIPRLKERGFLFIGGGVCDAYQQAESQYGLARAALEVCLEVERPVHVLTKSTLVARDLDLLGQINDQNRAILSFSISTLDPELAAVLEPGCPPPADRLSLLAVAKEAGLGAGVMLMPVLPLLSDADDQLQGAALAAKEAGADFVLMGGTTLKPGRQREHFYQILEELEQGLSRRYGELYGDNRWGHARGSLHQDLERRWSLIVRRHGIAPRIPHRLFKGHLEANVEVAMVLFHIHDLLRMRGKQRGTYQAAARRLMALRESVEDLYPAGMLGAIPGIGPMIQRIIVELLETGQCANYEELMSGK